jgi:hypothetical protein
MNDKTFQIFHESIKPRNTECGTNFLSLNQAMGIFSDMFLQQSVCLPIYHDEVGAAMGLTKPNSAFNQDAGEITGEGGGTGNCTETRVGVWTGSSTLVQEVASRQAAAFNDCECKRAAEPLVRQAACSTHVDKQGTLNLTEFASVAVKTSVQHTPPYADTLKSTRVCCKPTRVCWKPFVWEGWVEMFVQNMPKFTIEETRVFRKFLESEYGELHRRAAPPDAPGLTDGVVKKLQILDKLVALMTVTPCQDTRLVDSKKPIVTLSPVHGEYSPARAGRSLLLGCNITVNDPLAFNLLVRRVQKKHPSWPPGGASAKGTKGITEPLALIGLGPNADALAWKVRNGSYRGFENTDPDNPWTLQPGQAKPPRETDGCYFKEYCFAIDRVETQVRLDRQFHLYAAGTLKPPTEKTSRKSKTRLGETSFPRPDKVQCQDIASSQPKTQDTTSSQPTGGLMDS